MFWATLTLSCVSIVAVVFAGWELVENRFFQDADYVTLHYLYITRGIASSLLLAFWAAWYVLRQRRHTEEELRRSRERYRGLLEASPGAVALYDRALQVIEWNAAAESLYGFSKAEIVGHLLPTVPPAKEAELQSFLQQVAAGEPLLNLETLRCDKQGACFEVELTLLPFREPGGQNYFLEITADVRERVRLRQRYLEIEKLTSMGRMAAGTAHHLNTPLAAMLLRVEMMRDRLHHRPCQTDLEHLEEGMRFCQHFVQRLLEFGARTPIQKEPTEVARLIESMVSFLTPALGAKRASVVLKLDGADGCKVLADRSHLEALLSILFSNALDAIPHQGRIVVACRQPSAGWIEIQVADNGSGIPEPLQPRIFEPFFTTKEPGKGTGLGLAIARNIVVDHGGSIRLQSRESQGTTAVVELPLCQPTPISKGDRA